MDLTCAVRDVVTVSYNGCMRLKTSADKNFTQPMLIQSILFLVLKSQIIRLGPHHAAAYAIWY